jgi:hypothetical protein
MAVDVTAIGTTGQHAFAKTNVNFDDDFIYYKNSNSETEIPAVFTVGTTFIYSAAVGTLEGLVDGALLYVSTEQPKKLTFSTTAGGTAVNLTGSIAGGVTFNTPTVYGSKLNIDGSTPDNQAVKYYTTGDPMPGLTSGETYFINNVSISEFSGSQSLYTFTNHTFTACAQTGRVGPTQAQMRTAYNTPWDDLYLSQGSFQGYQDWTVPVSGNYTFTVAGASGNEGSGSGTAGRGGRVTGKVALTKGEVITIAVGQRGDNATSGTVYDGSGGGTFVVRKAGNEPLFVAGGGSSDANSTNGRDASMTRLGGNSSSNQSAGTSPGQGGLSGGGYSGGGGGFLTNGGTATFRSGAVIAEGGGGFNSGLTMTTNARSGGYGGFGGGAQSDGVFVSQSGGAGGYSGGAGARSSGTFVTGGGGGIFITPTALSVGTSNGTYDTQSTFGGVAITNMGSYNTGEGSVAVALETSFTTGNQVYPTAQDAASDSNQILVTPAGNSYHSFVPISFDIGADTIHSSTPHTLSDGEAIEYSFAGTSPESVNSATIYYVKTVNGYSYQLSTTPAPTYSLLDFTTPSSLTTLGSDTLSRVVVNTVTNTLTIPSHGFLVDQPLTYSTNGGETIVPLQEGNTYYVSQVVSIDQFKLKTSLDAPNSIDFTAAGSGTGHSFIFLTVNLPEDTLYIPNHGLVSGQTVVYSPGVNDGIGGLVDGNTYYVSRVDSSLIKLTTNQNLSLESVVNLTTVGTGVHTLTITSLDFITNTITVPGHGFLQGELVEYDSRGGQVVDGLTTATPYYIIFVNGDNIRLATTPENAAEGIGVEITDTPAGVGVHSLRSLSKTPDGIYEIKDSDVAGDKKKFTAVAQGTVPLIEKLFTPRAALDLNLNEIFLESHGFITGTEVTYAQGDSATDIGGLVDAVHYYVVSINKDYIKLSASAADAAAGITLPLTGYGTGIAHSLTTAQINGNITGGGSVSVLAGSVLVDGVGTSFAKILKVGDRFRLFPPNATKVVTFASADVSTVSNTITGTNTFVTGETVKFAAAGGQPPAPLVDGYYYFVRAVSGTQVTLHNSKNDADNNLNTVNFSSQGSGSAFTITHTVPVGAIIRRISAIGSDTQITVDRPYGNAFTEASYTFPTFLYVRPQGYALHRPFDGGVEMSVGAGTSLGQIVRQTRKYFRYQSGKGIQTSAGINFKPSIDLESMKRFSPTQILCKTRRPHGLISGLFVVVDQAEDSVGALSTIYNGAFQVTVDDLTTFRINSVGEVPIGVEAMAYGFPQFNVREWTGGAIRSGMFDFQNGMFYEFDGVKMYAVRRSSTQQLAGSVSCLQGSELVFGTNTSFTAQLDVGDYIVMRGQTYRVADIESDTRLSIRPEYKGASGVQKEFDPGDGTTGAVRLAINAFQLVGHGFQDEVPVVYDAVDGEQIGGLINGNTYYIDLIDNNSFKLSATPDAANNVELSSVGTTAIHAFTPAKSGIIVTKTVDARIPQEDWSIDPCDGTGKTGYNLDVSRIQMVYIDYSWYGAGKIRFGFKTTGGQVEYIHEFVHNNQLYESYFRSGNLPARYEVITYNDPTYIPSLFHWGTSVMMDGKFDDDRAYLFTGSSQSLPVDGTTEKSFSSTAINTTLNQITIANHGFRDGDKLQFEGVASDGFPGVNNQMPSTAVYAFGEYDSTHLENSQAYDAVVIDSNTIMLTPDNIFGIDITTSSQSGVTVTINTAQLHGLSVNSAVKIVGSDRIPNGAYKIASITDTDTFTFTVPVAKTATVASGNDAGKIYQGIDFTSQGNSQYTYFLYPDGALNNTSGPNYQPLISIRLSPSVSEGLTGKLGDRDIINRMQLRLQEVGISSTQLVDVKLLLNGRLNNLNFQSVDTPSLVQTVEHTTADTISGGIQVYNFRAAGGQGGQEESTTVDVNDLFELSNSILGGDSTFPDGPDVLTIAVSRLTANATTTGAKLTWTEAQA